MIEKLAQALRKPIPQGPVSHTLWPTIVMAAFVFTMWAVAQGVNYQVNAMDAEIASRLATTLTVQP